MTEMKRALFLLFFGTYCDCARILAILPINVKSHYIVMEPLLHTLASRGHQLTVYTSFPSKTPLTNLTEIELSEGRKIWMNSLSYETIEELMGDTFQTINHMFDFVASDCETVFKSNNFKNFDFHEEKYDLMITEMFSGDCFVHFAYKLKVPYISIVTSIPPPWIPDKFGVPDNPSYVPTYLVGYTPRMDFFQRNVNTFITYYSRIMFEIYSNRRIQRIAEEYFGEKLPWVGDVAKNSSLLLVNSHFSLSQSQPLTPNVIEVGGIHIKPKQPLSKDIQDILERATRGAILLSFGSMVRVSTIPKEKIEIILEVFKSLPQTVLFKFEEELPGCPENVILKKWLPQRDILEHKNLVAFISHGGLASIIEAVQFGVPIVGVPFFSDQALNIQNIAYKGAGVMLDLKTMTRHKFAHAVDQVLNNPKVRESMKRLSQQFLDRPMTPLQSAVYWTEYVARHGGAPHLRPASTSLPFYKLWLLDVLLVLIVTILTLCWLTKRALSALFKQSKGKEKLN